MVFWLQIPEVIGQNCCGDIVSDCWAFEPESRVEQIRSRKLLCAQESQKAKIND